VVGKVYYSGWVGGGSILTSSAPGQLQVAVWATGVSRQWILEFTGPFVNGDGAAYRPLFIYSLKQLARMVWCDV